MSGIVNLIIDGEIHNVKRGICIADVADKINNMNFSCLRGSCGRCVVKVIEGNLGDITESEKSFLELMDLDGSKYRLFCQTIITKNSVVEKY